MFPQLREHGSELKMLELLEYTRMHTNEWKGVLRPTHKGKSKGEAVVIRSHLPSGVKGNVSCVNKRERQGSWKRSDTTLRSFTVGEEILRLEDAVDKAREAMEDVHSASLSEDAAAPSRSVAEDMNEADPMNSSGGIKQDAAIVDSIDSPSDSPALIDKRQAHNVGQSEVPDSGTDLVTMVPAQTVASTRPTQSKEIASNDSNGASHFGGGDAGGGQEVSTGDAADLRNGGPTRSSTSSSRSSRRFKNPMQAAMFGNRLRGKVSDAAKRTQERGRMLRSNVLQAARQTGGRVRETVEKTKTSLRERIGSGDQIDVNHRDGVNMHVDVDANVDVDDSNGTGASSDAGGESHRLDISQSNGPPFDDAAAVEDGPEGANPTTVKHAMPEEQREDSANADISANVDTKGLVDVHANVDANGNSDSEIESGMAAQETELELREGQNEMVDSSRRSQEAAATTDAESGMNDEALPALPPTPGDTIAEEPIPANRGVADIETEEIPGATIQASLPDNLRTKSDVSKAKEPPAPVRRPTTTRNAKSGTANTKKAAKGMMAAARALRASTSDVGKTMVRKMAKRRTASSDALDDVTEGAQDERSKIKLNRTSSTSQRPSALDANAPVCDSLLPATQMATSSNERNDVSADLDKLILEAPQQDATRIDPSTTTIHNDNVVQRKVSAADTGCEGKSTEMVGGNVDSKTFGVNEKQMKEAKKAMVAVSSVAKAITAKSKHVGKTIARRMNSKRMQSSSDVDDGILDRTTAKEVGNLAPPSPSASSPLSPSISPVCTQTQTRTKDKVTARDATEAVPQASPSAFTSTSTRTSPVLASRTHQTKSENSLRSISSTLLVPTDDMSSRRIASIQSVDTHGNRSRKQLDVTIIFIIHCCLYSLDQMIVHRHEIFHSAFPWPAVVGMLLAAFAIGTTVDTTTITVWFDRNVLGIAADPFMRGRQLSQARGTADIDDIDATAINRQAMGMQQNGNRFRRFASRVRRAHQRRQRSSQPIDSGAPRSPSTNQSDSPARMARNAGIVARLPPGIQMSLRRFNSGRAKAPQNGDRPRTDMDHPQDDDGDLISIDADISLGSYGVEEAKANQLCHQEDLTPFFELRGMDVFLSDDAEEEAGTHPFLIQNGLRSVPTFIFNVMTQWGNILLYFKMPDWVKDFDESLVEASTDDDRTRALKRFLKGDDEYRRERLKIVPHLVAAPLPIRMMAPKDSVFKMHHHDLVTTIYNQHGADATTNSCCTVEVTVDLMSNHAIRGMAGIMKRYIKNIALDLAIVIRQPNKTADQTPTTVETEGGGVGINVGANSGADVAVGAGACTGTEAEPSEAKFADAAHVSGAATPREPEAVLGLFCLKNLDVSLCEQKPERYEGVDPASIEQTEALLLQKYAEMARASPQ